MVHGLDTWHDSDEIDSDLEQEAYNLLYYQNWDDKKNISQNNPDFSEKSLDVIENTVSDSEMNYIDLVNSSESIAGNESHSDSEIKNLSDSEVEYVKTVKCSNPVTTLYIGSSSDDSDLDDIGKAVNKNKSSFLLNISSDNKSKKSFNNSKQKDVNEIDKLFFKSNESDDDNWKVDIKPTEKSRRNSSRYFENTGKSTCLICSKKGHSESECTKSGPICILCGKEGHLSKLCDKTICFVCFKTDHSFKKCPYTPEYLRQVCRRCGHKGHVEEICPDLWRQYKYMTIPGPPVMQRCSSQNKSTVFCANCAKVGHFTEQCPRSRMNSGFLGPPPIMEIIKFEYCDIYKRAKLRYFLDSPEQIKLDPLNVEVPSFMQEINVTNQSCIAGNDSLSFEVESNVEDQEPNLPKKERKNSQNFGDGFIMLSPISKKTKSTPAKKQTKLLRSSVLCSTPHVSGVANQKSENKENSLKSSTKLPGITTELLKKLFPQETENHEKIPPVLRKKLRKKLKNFIYNGYLPGDTNLTQEKMEFWLQEISTGRNLNYREKKKLLGSVSAALHSISDRVSSVDLGESSASKDISRLIVDDEAPKESLSVPEARKERNKMLKEEKRLKNSLKVSKKEKKEIRKMKKEVENTMKARLRKHVQNSSVTMVPNADQSLEYKPKKKKRQSSHLAIEFN